MAKTSNISKKCRFFLYPLVIVCYDEREISHHKICKEDFRMKRLPMLGAAYYPEAWPEEQIPEDIAKMQQAGIHAVRIGEFAWHKMEPKNGEFHFAWLHDVISRLQEAGIAVILGTPSATPPIWLEELDLEMRLLDDMGLRHDHGGRRHCCSNNPTYRRYSVRIAEKMAQEFGNHPNVIGWQIDNEIAAFDYGCFCPHCVEKFKAHLRRRYGSIEKLNEAWNLELFSQAYDSFDQIPQPKPHTWHSPHLKYEWATFHADSHVEFLKLQADVLHKYTAAPVGTDMMPVFNQDYEKTTAFLDVVQYNHYDDENSLKREIFWFDYMRGLKDRPFWVTETATCWNGSTSTPSNFRREGFCKANSWLSITLGAEANFYWLWRQHHAGHELMHGAVLYASGRPMHIFHEVRALSEEYEKCADFLTGTKIVTDAALMVSSTNDYLMKQQEVVWEEGAHAWETAYTKRLYRFYEPITDAGLRCDIIPPSKDFSAYKLLFTPFMLTMEDGELHRRIENWVRDGGIWVAGPMTDIRNAIGAHYLDRETGALERLTGATMAYQVPDTYDSISCAWSDGSSLATDTWLQLFDVSQDARVLATVTDGYSALVGKALIFETTLGKGKIITMGVLPKGAQMTKFVADLLAQNEISAFAVSGKVVAARRIGDDLRGISAMEYDGKSGTLRLDRPHVDILTDTRQEGIVEFAPYQVRILREID